MPKYRLYPKTRDVTKVIRIMNLPLYCTEADLYRLAQLCPVTKDMFLAKDKATQAFRGFAYIQFKTLKDAKRAIEVLDGISYNNAQLRATFANSK